MYNGIGLVTPRGSGTNGYVQRNMSFIQKSREKVNYKTEDDIKKLDALANKKPNQGILAHERKRTIELKCLEMQELMEDQGYPDDEIDEKVAMFRQMLVDKEGVGEKEIPKDEFGRPIVKESHQIAEANQEKNSKMREALGISQYFVEGSSLDPERRAKEAAAAAAEEAKKKYTLIPDSSSSSSPERSQDKEKDKKRKKKKSHTTREKIEESPKKKKSVKKHKKDRSVSPDVQKKKKVKKPVKEKSKHKSKMDASRKKHSARSSSSDSSSSSESDGDESSSRASSRDSQSGTSADRHKSNSKHEKVQKANRKRSTSSERIRYSKDARSRKDIYEAKKDRHKRVRASSSSSSSSSPQQYYRLEPVLLKSSSKKHGGRKSSIIEIPSKSAFELKKYDRKKKVRGSSSSEVEEIERPPEGKKRKRSESPGYGKAARHRSERDEAKVPSKMDDSYKSSKRSEKNSHSSMPDKHHRDRSRSSGSQRKKHHKVHTVSDDESDDSRRKVVKERQKEIVDEKHLEKSSRNKKKHSRKESPVQHNGYHKHSSKSHAQESDDSDRSARSESVPKRKKHIPRSPSPSPVTYKNKKHIIVSPSYDSPSSHRKKFPPKSPSCSPPPKKSSSKHHRRQQSVSKSPPPKRSERRNSTSKSPRPKQTNRHDSNSSRSPSPVLLEVKRNGRDLKASNHTNKEGPKSKRTPPRRRDDDPSVSRSPSQHKISKTKSKQRSKRVERSPSLSVHSDLSEGEYTEKKGRPQERKSKGNAKEVGRRSRSHSPLHHKSKSKRNRSPTEEPSETRILSPKNKKGMTIIVESCQISPSKESANRKRDTLSASPTRVPSSIDTKKQKKDKGADKIASKSSPVWNKGEDSSPRLEKPQCPAAKVSNNNEINEVKIKRGSTDDSNAAKVVPATSTTTDDTFTARKSNWNLIHCSNPTTGVSESPLPKAPSVARTEEPKDNSNKTQDQAKKKASNNSPSRSRSGSKNPEILKAAKNKGRTPDLSRSRSRSTSVAHSRSGSERSSRSRSYSHRRSYSKSRSRSHSRSKSRSRSRSKSYSRSISIDSRSRSRSYSSRSRSRSNNRSPSIPRRRGSPSFLDKRRITSARKRPVPYRRPSPSTPSSTSSWSYRSPSSSPIRSPHSRSWSPLLMRQKHEVAALLR